MLREVGALSRRQRARQPCAPPKVARSVIEPHWSQYLRLASECWGERALLIIQGLCIPMTRRAHRKVSRVLIALLAGGVWLVLYASSQAQSGPPAPAALIADGKAWHMTTADGTDGRLTLTADGRGHIETFGERFSASWRETANGEFCLDFRPTFSEGCFWVSRDGSTIVGRTSDGRPAFRLVRP